MSAIHMLNKRKINAPGGKRDSMGLIHANSCTGLPAGLLWDDDSLYFK